MLCQWNLRSEQLHSRRSWVEYFRFVTCKFPFSQPQKNNTKNISIRQNNKQKRNSVEVQSRLSLQEWGEVEKTEHHSPLEKEKTVGAIFDQQMRVTDHTLLECWVRWRYWWAQGKGLGTCGKKKLKSTRSKIRLSENTLCMYMCNSDKRHNSSVSCFSFP